MTESPKPAEGAKPIAREPTQAMIDAGVAAGDYGTSSLDADAIWRAMWDAAPSPEGVGLTDALREARERIEARIAELWRQRGLAKPVQNWSESDHAYSVALSNVRGGLWDALDGHNAVGQEGPSEPEGGGA